MLMIESMLMRHRNQIRSSAGRRGSIGLAILALFVLLALAAVASLWFVRGSVSGPTPTIVLQQPLVVFCAASNQAVFEAVRKDYEAAYHVPIQVQYGASQTLLAGLEVSKSGDLYLPADDSYLKIAADRKLTAEQFPLAQMYAVVAVAKGNPKKIAKWSDLLREDVRLVQASPDGAAIGKLTRDALKLSNLWSALEARTVAFKTTVNETANDVKVGAADAGIVYDAVLTTYPTLEAVSLPELKPVAANVAAAVLQSSKNPQQALHFARYLSARDKGLVRYKEFDFVPAAGDVWAEQPEVTLYAGSMLRPAIERTITEFERREGVKVLRVYNGCGILVAQMKAGQVPDAYFACDTEFMKQVQDLFPDAKDISQNELVILVKKGNPSGIVGLRDLAKPGLRVGIGHEKQCAMGWITQRTLNEEGITADVMKNVTVQTPSGDMLVNQMRTGSLDAAVAYLSNAAGSVEHLDAIRIQGLPCSVATQPYAAAKDSKHPQLMRRLLQAIETEASQQVFAAEGFRKVEAQQGPK